MKRLLLCLVISVLLPTQTCLSQIRATATWQPTTARVELPGFGPHDINLNTLAGGVEVGLFSGWLTIFGEAGTGDAHIDGWGIDGSIDLFWRAGARADLWRRGPWSVGLAADVRQWRAQDSFLLADRPFGTQLHLTTYRVRPTLAREIGPVTFYGGPSTAWADGSLRVFWDTATVIRQNFKTKAEFGAFAGARWEIVPHVILTAEGEVTELGPAAVAGVAVSF